MNSLFENRNPQSYRYMDQLTECSRYFSYLGKSLEGNMRINEFRVLRPLSFIRSTMASLVFIFKLQKRDISGSISYIKVFNKRVCVLVSSQLQLRQVSCGFRNCLSTFQGHLRKYSLRMGLLIYTIFMESATRRDLILKSSYASHASEGLRFISRTQGLQNVFTKCNLTLSWSRSKHRIRKVRSNFNGQAELS